MLTLRAVFSAAGDLTPTEIFGALEQASPLWLGASLLCMTGFIVLEGLALLYLLRHLHCPRGFFRGLRYSAADQFFSAITPSATGGQPAAALVMRNHQVPGGVPAQPAEDPRVEPQPGAGHRLVDSLPARVQRTRNRPIARSGHRLRIKAQEDGIHQCHPGADHVQRPTAFLCLLNCSARLI